jgi:NAD+ synthase (glutamine-hydrolysing)
MNEHGFLRITAACSPTSVADPLSNRLAIEDLISEVSDSDVIVFQELSLSGYTCGELFAQDVLLESCLTELASLCQFSANRPQLIIVGMPMRIDGRLYNLAAAIQSGRLLGLVPKQYLPTYQEFYEGRWFTAGDIELPEHVDVAGLGRVTFGIDLLFESGNAVVGIEICEDLWMPVPPSSLQSLAGANVLLNLSASNETIGKASYRTQLVTSQSGRCCAAYAYASAGPGESTTDLVFGGHCMIAENGSLLVESERVGKGLTLNGSGTMATVDVDLQRIMHDRQVLGTMHEGRKRFIEWPFRRIPFEMSVRSSKLRRFVSGQPFVPRESHELDDRCREIFEIQCAGLTKRVSRLPEKESLNIGISGGLDSTLALLVATWTCQQHGWSTSRIQGLTMPGFGTSQQTFANSLKLMELLDVSSRQLDIRPACLQVFADLNHKPFGLDTNNMSLPEIQKSLEHLPSNRRSDLVFENVQARVRTLMLMSRGFVLGTGDLSESALGWSTYNGDHMSMYNVNCCVPKTLVRFLVRYVAMNRFEGDIRQVLLSIADTPISPELLPLGKDQKVTQATEVSIGPYELHDFFLYHFVRTGASPSKIRFLAMQAEFSQDFDAATIDKTLITFLRRFFANQFKRSCVPDGPKVGSVSLSPRGDWRMPSDASVEAWIAYLDDEGTK